MTNSTIEESFHNGIGTELEDFLLVSGGMLILYLGKVSSTEPLRTTCELLLGSAWRLEQKGEVKVGSLSEDSLVLDNLNRLRGKRLLGVAVARHSYDLSLSFEDGLKIVSFANSIEDMQWELKTRERTIQVAANFTVQVKGVPSRT